MTAMRVLRLRMLNSMEPLAILLRKSDAALFQLLGNKLFEGATLEDAWQELRNKARRSTLLADLNDDDMHILDAFFSELGKSGKEEQSELFAKILAEMEEVHRIAKNNYLSSSKLYTALGTLAGLAVCVLIV